MNRTKWTGLVFLGLALFAAGYGTGRLVEAPRGDGTDAAASPSPCGPTLRRQLIVYYFHPGKPSPDGRQIEAGAKAAVQRAFPGHLEARDVVWVTANLDEPGAEGFVDRYGLDRSTGGLVLVDTFDGRELKHQRLDRVWELLDDEVALTAYVQAAVRARLLAWASEPVPESE